MFTLVINLSFTCFLVTFDVNFHREFNYGTGCPMRKKGKCDFAHGPLELRLKDNRRDRWGIHYDDTQLTSMKLSGGEDVLGMARGLKNND